jgi:6-pyruvoyltetrahydropterin/6-carboxytetrahydropterin synthase
MVHSMFTLCVSDFVMIAHSLGGEFFGPAQRMHGATLGVDVEVRCAALDQHGVVVDIGYLRSTLRKVLEGLDYSNLDEHPAFPARGSTTERIAQFICQELRRELQVTTAAAQTGASVRVLLRESPVAWVAYEEALN